MRTFAQNELSLTAHALWDRWLHIEPCKISNENRGGTYGQFFHPGAENAEER